mmetsp:Transcript_18026/g.37730  ORF Transcript_18026/g.37730 Transcript_18026/m.37730 type:complete len:209 (+) Transcript_18026:433-1059(+)
MHEHAPPPQGTRIARSELGREAFAKMGNPAPVRRRQTCGRLPSPEPHRGVLPEDARSEEAHFPVGLQFGGSRADLAEARAARAVAQVHEQGPLPLRAAEPGDAREHPASEHAVCAAGCAQEQVRDGRVKQAHQAAQGTRGPQSSGAGRRCRERSSSEEDQGRSQGCPRSPGGARRDQAGHAQGVREEALLSRRRRRAQVHRRAGPLVL